MTQERAARAAWTVLSEPGDPVAGELLGWLGATRALAWLRSVERGAVDWAAVQPDGVVLAEPVRERLLRRGRTWAARLGALAGLAEATARSGVRAVVPGDPEWPVALDDLGPTAPHALWLRGSLTDRAGDGPERAGPARGVSLVGARSCSQYGQRVATDLADGLARRGVVVVSGGAYGIDAAAHRGALIAAGTTWAVLAGGADRAYPSGHAALFEQIVARGGAVLGEAPPGAVPARSRFLQRNRLIAALTAGTVVVEAAWRSGALSTAHHAARLLRPVGAVPGPVTSVVSAGCHRLLRDGVAVCVTDVDEVLELVGPLDATATEPDGALTALDRVDPKARALHDALHTRTPTTTGDLVARTGLPVGVVRAGLGRLDVAGLVVRDGEGWRAVPVRRVAVRDLGPARRNSTGTTPDGRR